MQYCSNFQIQKICRKIQPTFMRILLAPSSLTFYICFTIDLNRGLSKRRRMVVEFVKNFNRNHTTLQIRTTVPILCGYYWRHLVFVLGLTISLQKAIRHNSEMHFLQKQAHVHLKCSFFTEFSRELFASVPSLAYVNEKQNGGLSDQFHYTTEFQPALFTQGFPQK